MCLVFLHAFDCRQFSKLKVKAIQNKHILINLISFVIRKRRFPTKRKLLTDDEYWRQGQEETRKALAELRQHVRSPDCNAWKTISRLNSPHRYACIKIYYQLHEMLFYWIKWVAWSTFYYRRSRDWTKGGVHICKHCIFPKGKSDSADNMTYINKSVHQWTVLSPLGRIIWIFCSGW